MSGNGYMGLRGALPDARADGYAGATVSDTYDNADGKWKELCNAPNGLFCEFSVGDRAVTGETAQGYCHGLDFATGTTYGELSFELDRGSGTMAWRRFASYENLHLALQCIRFEVPSSASVEIRYGIDGDVWSLNGEHFRSATPNWRDGRAETVAETTEAGVALAVVSAVIGLDSGEYSTDGRSAWARQSVEIGPESPLELWFVSATYHENDGPNPLHAARQAVEDVLRDGPEKHEEAHREHWRRIWSVYDITIEGNDEDQRLLRYNTYHNVIATPAHANDLPIGARGLSCQAYQGAAFWDQEIFNLPMYIYTTPDVARNILTYRHKTLEGARKKAKRLGYRGAFYAWISGDTGEELCPDYFFRDVLTGRNIRNHFNDWQIHVSPDISYAVWHYYLATGDRQFLVDSGAEILFDVARFLFSRGLFRVDRDRYEIIRVLGPDEYHENVDNNFFTNFQTRFALQRALDVYEMLSNEQGGSLSGELATIRDKMELTENEISRWRDMVDKLYIPAPDPDSGIIEQFDGYFDLEDITPDALAERLIDENEYWGWPNGIAYHTQVTKQADVVQLFALHSGTSYDTDIVRKNYEYYEPRTQHRSSLSPGVHAIVAARIGNLEEAERYLEHSMTIDLRNTNPPESGGTFIGGIHTAACGIAWQIVVFGFLGLAIDDQAIVLDPRLPKDWVAVRVNLQVRGHRFEVSTNGDTVELLSRINDGPDLSFRLKGQHASTVLHAGETVTLASRSAQE